MKVSDVKAGDVFLNPIDHDCAYLLTDIVVGSDGRAAYNWFNLCSGVVQDLTEPIDEHIALEWIVMRGGLVIQESGLTEDWKEIQEVAA
jgi:hypothetical protein